MKRRLIFLLVFWLLLNPFLNKEVVSLEESVSLSEANSIEKEIASLVSYLANLQGKRIALDKFIQKTGNIPPGIIYEPYLSRILSAARDQGLFLLGFKLNPELKSLSLLQTQKKPFIAYSKNEGYLLIEEIASQPEGLILHSRKHSGEKFSLKGEDFIKSWNGHIFSFPLVNILAERINYPHAPQGRFISIYSYHREDFEKLKKILDVLREEATRLQKKLIYIDELGLIPKETVKNLQEGSKLSEKEAFENAKHSLRVETEGFEKGISTYDENPFYQAQYSYLANYRIKSYMEDLDYENWKRIVAFDDLNLHNEAIRAFCMGDVKTYLDKLREYVQGFWFYNVKERDENFRRQIKKIAEENPGSIIFTLRGIGHYGTEEPLDIEGFTIETMAIAEGDFQENLISDQMTQVMLSNGVYIPPEERNLLYLRSFPEECLRTYLQKRIESLALATRLAKRIVDRVTAEEIKGLSRDISYAFAKGKINDAEAVWEYVFNWAKERGKVVPEEIP
ncbi:MAG: hypothetical protein NC898_03005 [Candidatus Omnitrophica bacterium]|nr:hypothetical protein [Candidatus Omnitrophota bacterium]MCM8793418.1 hypothetical protein [Candidatus Omnitrophota bacterium]